MKYKTYVLGFFVLLLTISSALAYEVDCDKEKWWHLPYCKPEQLQDEFDEVQADNDRQDEEIQQNSDDIEQEAYLRWQKDFFLGKRIKNNAVRHNWLKDDVESLDIRLSSEEDKADRKGTSATWVKRFLYKVFYPMVQSYVDEEIETVNQRLDYLEANKDMKEAIRLTCTRNQQTTIWESTVCTWKPQLGECTCVTIV